MTTYRLWPSTNGPASSTATGNNDIFNTGITLTSWGLWLDGYWWWRADSGQPSGAQKFCLYQASGNTVGTLIPGSTVTSSVAFSIGWNYIPLPAPIPLSKGVAYRIATGLTGNFPFTSGYWGTGGPGINGITNGPLTAYSDVTANGGTLPELFNNQQCTFSSAAGNDPTVGLVGNTSSSFNAWQDVQVDTAAPGNATYRLWPNLPVPPTQALDTANNFTLGTEFILSQACALNKIWFYSPATVTQLPTRCAIWGVPGGTIVSGTDNASPSWSGAAGSGWISVTYPAGVVLPAGKYKTTVFNGAGVPAIWSMSTAQYWSTGAGGSGITTGPLSAPNDASADAPGQSSYHLGAAFAFPDTHAGPFNYWVDAEVTPVGSGLLLATFP